MNKRNLFYAWMTCLPLACSLNLAFAQNNNKVKNEHAQIGIVEDEKSGYKRTDHPDAQWFPQAGFGMFIHWSISSIKEVDLSWPMMAGNALGWGKKLDSLEVKKLMDAGDYFGADGCKKTNSCLTPNEYWALAKDFNPQNYDPEKWIKAAKEAGMTYAVLTTRHHDGFAMWPSAYGDFNTKNYMGGRDLVKEFVAACRKYGLKVGLYYSGPDWYFNKDYQNFMNYGVNVKYKNIPVLDENSKPRTSFKSEAEKEAHYKKVAAYVKGQIEELLTNYGKIDLIWFDGKADIPYGNKIWDECMSMERIHQLQPGIVVSPRFFGYGDYKTFESDWGFPKSKQDGWAEFCTTITEWGWGYTKSPMKSTAHVLNLLVKAKALNTNMLLNYGPTKEGIFTPEEYKSLGEIAAWMKVNRASIKGTQALSTEEAASVPAVAAKKHRYLFLLAPKKGEKIVDEKVTFNTNGTIKEARLTGSKTKLNYTIQENKITIEVPANLRTTLPDVIDVVLK